MLRFGDSLSGEWKGSATELLNTLNATQDVEIQRRKDWPKDGRNLSNKLRNLAPNLHAAAVSVTFGREPGGKRPRWIAVQKMPVKQRPERPMASLGGARGDASYTTRDARGDAADHANHLPGTVGTDRDAVLQASSIDDRPPWKNELSRRLVEMKQKRHAEADRPGIEKRADGESCLSCRSTEKWRRLPDEPWTCVKCHPFI